MPGSEARNNRRRLLRIAAGMPLCASVPLLGLPAAVSARTKYANRLTSFGFKVEASQLNAIEKALKLYMACNPSVSVTYEGVGEEKYHRILSLRCKTGNLDDIFMVTHQDMGRLARQNLLADLSDVIRPENYPDFLVPQFVREDGTILHVPMNMAFHGLFINKALIRSAGTGVPRNYGEFAYICDHFCRRGVTPVLGNSFDFLHSLVLAKAFYPELKGQPFAYSQLIEFNGHPERLAELLSEGLELVRIFRDREWINVQQVLSTPSFSQDAELFTHSRNPFLISKGRNAGLIAEKMSLLKFRIEPFPFFAEGSVLPLYADTNLAIHSKCEAIKEARHLLTFVMQEDLLQEYCESQTGFLPFKEPKVSEKPLLRALREAINQKRIVAVGDFRMNPKINEAIVYSAQEILLGTSTKKAMDILSARIDALKGQLFLV